MAADVQWTIIGSTAWSKTYKGKQSVVTELLGTLSAKLTNGNTMTAHRFIAEDDYVAVEARGRNMTRMGKPYENTYCWVFRLRDGKVSDITEYADMELITASLGDPQ